jgi:hypothetical protein
MARVASRLRESGPMQPGAWSRPVEAPLTRAHHRWLRSLVLAHHEAEHRRRHPPALHAAYPGRAHADLRLDANEVARLDEALRVDLWEGLVVRARWEAGLRERHPTPAGPWLWVTREGSLDDVDPDAAWVRSVHAAAAETGVRCPFVIVVRNGWRDPVSGVRRQWARLRRSG